MNLLEVRVLSKRFGGLQALDKVGFEVDEGEIFSVIGPNGAGKSTLFKILAGAMRPTEGQVVFRGKRLEGRSQSQVARAGLVRTFQETTVFPELTPREHVVIAHHLRSRVGVLPTVFGTWKAEVEEREFQRSAQSILKDLEMEAFANEPARTLPHGHLRVLGIAMALAARPRLLLLDEPFAGMNTEESARAAQLVRRIRERGTTVMLVEHDMRTVMALSDRIAVLSFGRKLAEGRPEAIQKDPAVIEAYLGREDDELGI
jgi:branched-chain amino acid transport system ATP-binding protein